MRSPIAPTTAASNTPARMDRTRELVTSRVRPEDGLVTVVCSSLGWSRILLLYQPLKADQQSSYRLSIPAYRDILHAIMQHTPQMP